MPKKPSPQKPSRLLRDKPIGPSDLSGYTGKFEAPDGWEPSMARRFGELLGIEKKKR